MNVLHVLWSGGNGGITTLVSGLVEMMNAIDDISVDVFRMREGILERADGTAVEPICRFRNGFDIHPARVSTLVRMMKQYDIVHLHSYHPAFLSIPQAIVSKTIITLHGGKGINSEVRTRDLLINRLRTRFLRRRELRIVAVSEFVRSRATRVYGIKRESCFVVPNGVRCETVSDSQIRNQRPAGFHVGCFANLVKSKRHDRLLSSWRIFALNKAECRLWIVGEGPQRRSIEDLVIKFQVQDSVKLIGWIDGVAPLMKAMDITVLPSQNEPFGLSALESLLQQVPVLCFGDGGGLVEVVQQYHPHNVVANEVELADRMEHYYENYRKGAIYENSWPQSREHDIRLCAQRYIDVYRKRKTVY